LTPAAWISRNLPSPVRTPSLISGNTVLSVRQVRGDPLLPFITVRRASPDDRRPALRGEDDVPRSAGAVLTIEGGELEFLGPSLTFEGTL
jgi:hypothetical protein